MSRKRKPPHRHPARTGNCAEMAIKVALDVETEGQGPALVCHGWPVGLNGAVKGQRYFHAWVEVEGIIVIDYANGREHMMPRDLYYSLGTIEEENVHRYDLATVSDMLDTTGHMGPWVRNPYAIH